MSAKPFRFFRGELNGRYIQAALLSHNEAVADIIEEIVYQASVAFALESAIVAGQSPIRDEDLLGLAQFAGILRPIQYLINYLGSMALSGRHAVGGAQYSERGLFNMATEVFDYIRDDPSTYSTDIATQATPALRCSLIPHGQAPIGYCTVDTVLFDADGTYHPENLLSSAPTDGTHYEPYYGPQFLTLENDFENDAAMPIEMFMDFYKAIVRMRANGASVAALCDLTQALTQGYVCNIEIVPTDYYYTLKYDLNSGAPGGVNESALNAWLAVVAKRFKNFVVEERTS